MDGWLSQKGAKGTLALKLIEAFVRFNFTLTNLFLMYPFHRFASSKNSKQQT